MLKKFGVKLKLLTYRMQLLLMHAQEISYRSQDILLLSQLWIVIYFQNYFKWREM